jgi:light-regulated signal transduction histidine kinase (bacteriophytochrome)
MIEEVWKQLISNALKFSSGRTTPKIEIGADKQDGYIHYYVKDNGIGFDMKYYNKLFGVFQSLHSSIETGQPGVSVGLALAHRIISRHGGRLWAEGKVNKGAIFYFSLPDT